ncbi:MAG: hypothetical protein IJ457_05035 [Clostridia bacterium]|nr:hypothetical protein [Clostridia bacterium]
MLTKYFEECKNRYTHLDFKRKGDTFIRVIGDVWQTFTIRRFRKNKIRDIGFSLRPLCEQPNQYKFALKNTFFLEEYRACDFGLDLDRFYFNRLSVENEDELLKEVFDFLECTIIPLFERGTDCATALMGLNSLDDYKAKLMGLDFSIPTKEKYYMALKTSDFEYAIKYLLNDIRGLEMAREIDLNEASKPDLDDFYREQNDKHLRYILLTLEKVREELAHAELKDSDYFRDRLIDNERIALSALAKYIVNN